jgi:type II secretory pathway pseudopilin PulG
MIPAAKMRVGDRGSDVGVTLIEVIIYVILVSILSGVITMILVNSWRTQEDVVSVTDATNKGQVMSSAIERAVRNGLDYEITNGGNTLKVRTSLGGSLACQGFHLVDGQSARFSSSNGLLAADPGSWAEWVAPVESEVLSDDSVVPFFREPVGVTNTVGFTFLLPTESAPVRFDGEVATRSDPTGGSSPCW